MKKIIVKMPQRKPQSGLSQIVQGLILYGMYFGIGHWLSGNGLMSTLLSPSGTPSFGAVAAALVYVLLRLFMLAFLPAMIVWRIWHAMASKIWDPSAMDR